MYYLNINKNIYKILKKRLIFFRKYSLKKFLKNNVHIARVD